MEDTGLHCETDTQSDIRRFYVFLNAIAFLHLIMSVSLFVCHHHFVKYNKEDIYNLHS